MQCPCGRTIRKTGADRCSEHGPGHGVLYAAALVELERFDPFLAYFYQLPVRRGERIGRADVQNIRECLRDVVQGRRMIEVAGLRRTDRVVFR